MGRVVVTVRVWTSQVSRIALTMRSTHPTPLGDSIWLTLPDRGSIEFSKLVKMSIQDDPVQREIHQDWANREYIEVITSSIKKIADFLNSFGKLYPMHSFLLSSSGSLVSYLAKQAIDHSSLTLAS
uniref:Uncharacterized protein n=1 Tax=Oncorhynchus tshawytscha TaxID=74940 RepID=A0AAZ3QWF8_ONCTS